MTPPPITTARARSGITAASISHSEVWGANCRIGAPDAKRRVWSRARGRAGAARRDACRAAARRADEHELQGDDAGGAYVVRISGKDTGLLAIDRENEAHNTIAAAETGVGAPVVASLPEHDALVLEFIEGEV